MPDHYGSLADATTYHAARGNAAWGEADEAAQTAALVRASQALDALYGARYPGEVATADQALLWPRIDATYRGEAVDDTTVPLPIIRATYELALRELQAPGSVAPDLPAGPQKVLTEVKGIKWSIVGGAGETRTLLPIVDGILDELLITAPTGTSVTTLARF